MGLPVPLGRKPALLRGVLMIALLVTISHLRLHLGLEDGVVCRSIGPVTWEENMVQSHCCVLPSLETGDVLVTKSVHSLGWRHGHCALVVNGEKNLILEATALSTPSCLQPAEVWERYSTIWLLRPEGFTPKQREQLAAYGMELEGIPYSLVAGKTHMPGAAQCASLVWYAYWRLGYDIDGNGGWLVSPDDLLHCDLFQVTRLR